MTCLNPGHTPLTIALSPLLFQCEIMQDGVIVKKRNKKKLSAKVYDVCSRSGQALFESQLRHALENYQRTNDSRRAHTARWQSLVTNFVGTSN